MAEPRRKAGRPPVQHIEHVHVLSLSPELEEKIDGLQETFIKGKALRAVGEAAKGVLSHPAGIVALTGLVIWLSGRLNLWKFLFPGATSIVEGVEEWISGLPEDERGSVAFLRGSARAAQSKEPLP